MQQHQSVCSIALLLALQLAKGFADCSLFAMDHLVENQCEKQTDKLSKPCGPQRQLPVVSPCLNANEQPGHTCQAVFRQSLFASLCQASCQASWLEFC